MAYQLNNLLAGHAAMRRSESILEKAVEPLGATLSANQAESLVVHHGKSRTEVRFCWAGRGWPSEVARAISPVGDPWPRGLVVTAKDFSSGALELLRERDANWADETGNVRIVAPTGLLIYKEADRSARSATPARLHWSPASIAVAEWLLARVGSRGGSLPPNAALASVTGFTPGRVAQVLRAFDQEGFTRKEGAARGPRARRVLSEPALLLDVWADAAARQGKPRRLAHRALPDPMGDLRGVIAPVFEREIGAWALSGWAGLDLTAPFVTQVPVLHIYVRTDSFDDGLDQALAEAGLREVEEGARVEIWAAPPYVFELSDRHDDLPVVSPPRLYADLLALGDRGRKAANHVRGELIGF